MKIVVNSCYGGYGLSEKAYEFLGLKWDDYGCEYENDRTCSKLIECVESLKEEASGSCANLKVIEIPDDVAWFIDNYDGMETVEEEHRSW